MCRYVFVVMLGLCGLSTSFAQDKSRKAFDYFEEAEGAYNQDRYEQALQVLNELLKEYPGYYEAYALRGSVREILKDDDGALTDYSIYLEQFPEHVSVLISRAILRYKIGFYEQAREDFLRLLKMDPSETNTVFYRQNMHVGDRNPVMTPESGHKSYIYNYLGLTEAKQNDHRRAVAFYDSALALNPAEPDYFVNRGLSKEVLNDSTAADDYEQALKLNYRHTLAHHNLTALQAKQGITVTYEDRLTETIERDPDMLYPYLERAQERFAAGNFKGAVDDYTRALAIDRRDAEIWLGRGLALEKLNDFKSAFSDYTQAIEIREDFFKAWINRGNVLYKMERFAEAIEDFDVALIYQSNYAPAIYNRAMAKVRMNDRAGACQDLKLAERLGMSIDPKIRAKICD